MPQTLWSCLAQLSKNPELSHETYHKRMGTRLQKFMSHAFSVIGKPGKENNSINQRQLLPRLTDAAGHSGSTLKDTQRPIAIII